MQPSTRSLFHGRITKFSSKTKCYALIIYGNLKLHSNILSNQFSVSRWRPKCQIWFSKTTRKILATLFQISI